MNEETENINPDFLKKVREVFYETPYLQLLGMELLEMTEGAAIIKLPMQEKLLQPHKLMHGGATASVIDTAMAFAIVSILENEEKASTVDLTVHYLRPVADGEIICTAKVIRAGKRLLTVSAEVNNDKGKLIATALSTYTKL